MTVENIQINQSIPNDVKHGMDRLREAVGKVVGLTFFGAMLKSMRDSKLSGSYGHGGRGEQVFAEQLHGMYAERLGTSLSKGSLGDALLKKLAKQQTLISQLGLARITPEFSDRLDGKK